MRGAGRVGPWRRVGQHRAASIDYGGVVKEAAILGQLVEDLVRTMTFSVRPTRGHALDDVSDT